MYGEIAVGDCRGRRGRHTRKNNTVAIRISARDIGLCRRHAISRRIRPEQRFALTETHRQPWSATLVIWNRIHTERKPLPSIQKTRNNALIIVLSVTFVAGMAIALAIILLWRSHPAMAQGSAYQFAVAACPPFILVGSVGGITDTTLSLVLTAGVMVFANGALYAGLAAFVYWAVTTFWPKTLGR